MAMRCGKWIRTISSESGGPETCHKMIKILFISEKLQIDVKVNINT